MKQSILHCLVFILLPTVFSGCIWENNSKCPIEGRTLIVKAYDNAGKELSSGETSEVTMYVFNEADRLIKIIPTEVGRAEHLDASGLLRVVAVAGGEEYTSAMQPSISKLADGYMDTGLDNHIADIFQGMKLVAENDSEAIVAIRRVTARVYIEITGLKSVLTDTSSPDEADIDVVLAAPYNRLAFDGTLSCADTITDPYPVNYPMNGAFREADDFYCSPQQSSVADAEPESFRVLGASDDGMPVQIRLFYKGKQIAGSPFTSADMKLINGELNVIKISFSTDMSVTIDVGSWNRNDQEDNNLLPD